MPLLISALIILGCGTHINANIKPIPQKAFVKIIKNIHVKSCRKNSEKCKVGVYSSSGSGSVISRDSRFSYILTAAHVCSTNLTLQGMREIKEIQISIYAITHKGETHRVEILHSNRPRNPDLCLLTSQVLDINPIKISRRGPKLGDRLFCLAAPAGIYHPPAVPIFEGLYSGMMPDGLNIISTIPAVGGSSGAPVLNYRMELVGVLFATHPQFHQVTISTAFGPTKEFLQKHIRRLK